MKKRLLSLLLAVVMILGMLPVNALAADATSGGSCGDNLTWTYDEITATLTISGTGKMEAYKSTGSKTSAPWKNYITSMEKVVVEEGVTSIGANAFYACRAIQSVTLPSTLTVIEKNAFNRCSALKNIKIPVGVTEIPYGAFQYCSALEDITIPEGITTIGDYAFQDCTSLTSIVLPNTVTNFGSLGSNFNGCSGLKTIEIPAGVTELSSQMFNRASGLESIILPAGLKSIKANTFYNTAGLKTIYFRGDYNEWKAVNRPFTVAAHISFNQTFLTANVIYNYGKEENILQ